MYSWSWRSHPILEYWAKICSSQGKNEKQNMQTNMWRHLKNHGIICFGLICKQNSHMTHEYAGHRNSATMHPILLGMHRRAYLYVAYRIKRQICDHGRDHIFGICIWQDAGKCACRCILSFRCTLRPVTLTNFLNWHDDAHTKHELYAENWSIPLNECSKNTSISFRTLPK